MSPTTTLPTVRRGDDATARTDEATLRQWVDVELAPRYRVRHYLGSGGLASVWCVEDRVTGERVAAKRLREDARRPGDFWAEIGALSRVAHPAFTRLLTLHETAGAVQYLFLEYCAGGSLRRELDRLGGAAADPARVRAIARTLAGALEHAHAKGVAHCDLKPENVLFAEPCGEPLSGPVKVADLGFARALGRLPGGRPVVRGTPAYMAPEQFGGDASAASDLYALGVVLFELLHGRRPFAGEYRALARAHARETPPVSGRLPAPWPELLLRLLAKEPRQRIDAAGLRAALDPARGPRRPGARRLLSRCLGVEAAAIEPLGPVADDGPARDSFAVLTDIGVTVHGPGRRRSGATVTGVQAIAAGRPGELVALQGRRVLGVRGRVVEPLLRVPAPVRALAAGDAGFACATADMLLVYGADAEGWALQARPLPVELHDDGAAHLRPGPGGSWFLAAGVDRPALWWLGDEAEEDGLRVDLPAPCVELASTRSAAWVRAGRAGLSDVLRWSPASRSLETVTRDAVALAASPDRCSAAVLAARGELEIWADDAAAPGRLDLHAEGVDRLAWSGSHLAALVREEETWFVRVWNVAPAPSTATPSTHRQEESR